MARPPIVSNARRWREHYGLTLQTMADLANAALRRTPGGEDVPRWDVTALSKFERRTRNHYSIARVTALSDATRAARSGDWLSLDQLADRMPWSPADAAPASAVA